MQLINELAYVINLGRPKDFDEYLPANSKVRQLFLQITEKNSSDEEAAKIIYGTSHKDKKFLMLKRNLVSKLTELVLQVDSSNGQDSYFEIEMDCDHQLSIASRLLELNVFHNAEKILKKVLTRAEKYHLVRVQYQAYQLLRKIAYLIPNPSDTNKYNELANLYRNEHNVELTAKGFHEVLLSQVKGTKSVSKKIINYALESEFIIKGFASLNPHVLLTLFRIRSIRLAIERKWNKLRSTLNKIDELTKKYPYIITDQIHIEILLTRVRMLSATRAYDESEKTLKKAYQKTSYSAFNIFDFKIEEFDMLVKTKSYEKAGAILLEVIESAQFNLLNPIDKASWLVREAHLFFLGHHVNSTIQTYVQTFTKNYSLQDFMKGTSALTKDKRGFNIQYLIARMLLLWTNHKRGIYDEGNNLKTYYQRYIKESKQPRTHIFFKKLSKFLKYSNNPVRRTSIVAEFENEISQHADYYEYCEILPYEDIFHILNEQ